MKLSKSTVTGVASVVTIFTVIVIHIGSSESTSTLSKFTNKSHYKNDGENTARKLLILGLDGFRWDYYNSYKEHLPGFRQFLDEGCQAAYVAPIFPSLTYPSWTTILTGLYPEYHNIIGNYMLHRPSAEYPQEAVFSLDDETSTRLDLWWKSVRPLWVTAAMKGHQVYVANFANCDLRGKADSLPIECTGRDRFQRANLKLRQHLNDAVDRLKQGYSLAMVYDVVVDHVGHAFGPHSMELVGVLQSVDAILQELLINLKNNNLDDKINVIIVSDHGMTTIKEMDGIKYVKLEDYLGNDNYADIDRVIDSGAVVNVVPMQGKTEAVFRRLLNIPGVDVYQKPDIPDEFYYKDSPLVPEILLVAHPGYYIVGLPGDKEIPNNDYSNAVEPYAATHGYYNMTDMRTIFYARGPAFRRGFVHPPIRLVDEYQIFTEILEMRTSQHNGTWENVKDMFTSSQ